MTLGLAVWCAGDPGLYKNQLLCAGAVLGGCCLAPVQSRRSVAPFFTEKHNAFDTLSPHPRKWPWWLQGDPWWPQRAPGCPSRAIWRWPQRPFWDPASRIPSPGFLLWDSPPRNPLSRFLFQDSSPRIPCLGFLLKDSSSRISLQGSSSRIPLSGALFQDSSSRIAPLGFLF